MSSVKKTWFNRALGRWVAVLDDGRETYRYRWMMEEHLGRRLERHEHVHHVNGDSADDRLENLQVLTSAVHSRVHLGGRPPANKLPENHRECEWCGDSFVAPNQGERVQRFCTRRCGSKSSNSERRVAA